MALEQDSLGALNAYALKEREKNQTALKAEAEKRVRDYEAELQTLLGSLDAYQKQGTQTAQPLDPSDPMFLQKLQTQQQRAAMTGSNFRLPGQNSLEALAADPTYNPQSVDWESMQAGAQKKLQEAQRYAQSLETVPGYQEAVNKARGGGAGDLDAYLFGAMSADDGTQSRLHAAKTQGEQLGLRGMEQQRRDADYMQSLQAKRGELARGNREKYAEQEDQRAYSDFLNNSFADYLEQVNGASMNRVPKEQIAAIRSGSGQWGQIDAGTRANLYGQMAQSQQGGRFDIMSQLYSGNPNAPKWGSMSYADFREKRRNQQSAGADWLNQNKPKNSGWGGSGGW